MPDSTEDQDSNWSALVEAFESYISRFNALLGPTGDRVNQIRRGLQSTRPIERGFALSCVPYLEVAEQQSLLDLLVELCMQQRYSAKARGILCALPRDIVLANVEQCVQG